MTTHPIGDEVQFERDRSTVVTGTITSIQGRDSYRVCGVRGPGDSENNLIPERFLQLVHVREGVSDQLA